MDTINEIKRQELPEEQEIDLIELAQKLWKERKFLLKGCGIAGSRFDCSFQYSQGIYNYGEIGTRDTGCGKKI